MKPFKGFTEFDEFSGCRILNRVGLEIRKTSTISNFTAVKYFGLEIPNY